MRKNMLFRSVAILVLVTFVHVGRSQTYPSLSLNQSYTAPSPNAQSFESYDNSPAALYGGLPAVGIPVYTIKCGTLTVPISLSYNNNGFFPLQDAGWVGFGWNLNAGGVITRSVEGYADGSLPSGHNYGQYSLSDSVSGPNYDSFLRRAYNLNLGYTNTTFDVAPDIFDAEFNGIGGQFFWVNGTAQQISYNKQLSISWPGYTSNIVITTSDGTQYTFGATEKTTDKYYIGLDSSIQSFTSAWFLTRMVSVQGDTIIFNYGTYTWQQAVTTYQAAYTLNGSGGADLGYDPNQYLVAPGDSTQILQSIVWRNGRVSFIPDAAGRTDISGTLPRLREIVVIDSLTADTVKKDLLSYKYFGASASNPKLYERLALKTFSTVNPLISSDSLTYTFKYINESDTAINGSNVGFPAKNTLATDYWGFYNGASSNSVVLPPPNSIYYNPAPPSGAGFGSGVNRNPDSSYSSYGVLDTIVYPTGGYTAFQYLPNRYTNTGHGTNLAPGLHVVTSTMYDGINPTPALQKSYTYLADDGVTPSGRLTNVPNYNGPQVMVTLINPGIDTTVNFYNQYSAPNRGAGIGGINPIFYYSKVTESVSSNGETHKTDHYFTQYPSLMPDVRETQRIDYRYIPGINSFTPVSKVLSAYKDTTLGSLFYIFPFIATELVNKLNNPEVSYTFGNFSYYWNYCWIHPTSQQSIQYDIYGDSLTTTTNFFFNNNTRNLAYTETQGSDGQTMVKKFKYPEDYTSAITGNMVAHNVVGPPIESQTWLKQDASDSLLLAGSITVFDQSIFKPDSAYAIETTKPVPALSNETTSGGLYNNLLSDAHYVIKGQLKYDAHTNLSTATKASDIPISYIWDYRHSNVIAEVSNAAQADIAYTSFEADGSGNWAIPSASRDTGGISGSHCYNLSNGNITMSGLTSTTTYIFSFWSKAGASVTISGGTSRGSGKTIGTWTYYEKALTGTTTATVFGSGDVDEFRLYPANAQMNTWTYTPLIGVSSKCDVDNRVTYYQYDPFGRLKVVLDQDHNIVKTVQYHTIGETVE